VPDLSAFPNPTVNAAGTAGTTSAAGADSGTGVAAANDTGSLVSGNVNYSFSVAAGGSTLTADGSFLAAGAGHADLSFSSPEVTVNSPAPGARITTNG
ncbi:hypothetical protein, partial [Glaesserella parasuis]|uniref:hypothetical protein n=1 Tax=Glaesserella parasuis TaxID=738 RepID=UPI003F39F3EC